MQTALEPFMQPGIQETKKKYFAFHPFEPLLEEKERGAEKK